LSKLGQLLSYLERPGVTELVFRSGVPAVMRSANRLHPLTVTPLQVSQIQRFFEGTPVVARLPKGHDVAPQTAPTELLGTIYQVTIARSEGELEVRVAKEVQPRSTTWTDLPAVDVPVMRERRTSTGEGMAAPPPSPGLPSRTLPAERDSSPSMLAASPEWIIERNEHGPDLARPEDTTHRDSSEVALPLEPAMDMSELRSGNIEHASAHAVTPAAAPAPTTAPAPAALAPPRAQVFLPPRASTPAPVRVEARGAAPLHARLRELLVTARQLGASDVHIMADNPVRMRRAGALDPVGAPLAAAEVEAMVMPLLQPAHATQLEALGYADLAANVEGAGRMRININRQRTGLKLCLRLVVSEPPTIAALGLPPEVHELTKHHQGLVIISGPNGHGKTTSMAALVDMFNSGHAMHIITVEDPVEVVHLRKQAIVTQREVGSHTRSFARALTAALREDPDVIAIGELRDRETVEMALSAAETGHLVLATMSTPSAAKTIDRMIDMFPPGDQAQVRATLAGALKLVISQRLLRRADGAGLVAAFEMISGGVPLWSLIRDNKLFQLPSLLQRGRNFGMIGLDDSLRELLARGLITQEEALTHANDPKALAPREPSPTPPNASEPGWRLGRGR
jgi:twitching motility protein PilT